MNKDTNNNKNKNIYNIKNYIMNKITTNIKTKMFSISMILILSLVIFSSCSNNSETNNNTNNTNNNINNNNNNNEIQNNTVETYDKIIVAFGDSLTEGLGVERDFAYPAILERELQDLDYNVKVYNSGSSGETSSGALVRVDWVLQLNPDIVILGIGANDAIRGINLNLTRKNIENIIDKLKENNVTVILSGQIIFDNLGQVYVNEFEGMYPQITKEKNVSLIPIFLKGVAANSSLNNRDEIHPNANGYEIIVKNNVLPKVIEMLE